MTGRNLEGTVWFSDLVNGARAFPFQNTISEKNSKESLDIWKNSCQGIPQLREKFADKYFWLQAGRIRESLGHISKCAGSYIVSEPVAAILRQFNLGQTRLYPTSFFEADRVTPVPGQYHCISFGETRQSVVVEQSKLSEEYKSLYPPFRMTDTTFTVQASSLNGPDLWFDTVVMRTLLLSGGLVAALRAAHLDKPFLLTQCVVADE